VIALGEKTLRDFLRDWLAKQANVRTIPVITFAYK
jgi:ribosome-binding factor A